MFVLVKLGLMPIYIVFIFQRLLAIRKGDSEFLTNSGIQG